MNYWSGSGVDSEEIEMSIYCPECETDIDDVVVYAEGSLGTGTCPICKTEIEVEV